MEQQSSYLAIGSGIVRLTKKWADSLIECRLSHPGSPGWDIPLPDESDLPRWNNPENIASGVSGIILFLIEHYKQDKRVKYLKHIERAIKDLLVYCKNNPTANYSLYTGRAGVVYLLMQLYDITGDKRLIKEGIAIMQPSNGEYLLSRHVSDHLYDGRAGTLLLLLELYAVSGEGSLLGYIEQFTSTIIANARLLAEGMFWGNEEEPGHMRSCGFAFGSSGINFVFRKLSQYCGDPTLELVLSETERYKKTCWVEEFQSWGNLRKDILNKETLYAYKELYSMGDRSFLEPRNDLSWSHAGPATCHCLLDGVSNSNPGGLIGQPGSYTLYNGNLQDIVSWRNGQFRSEVDKLFVYYEGASEKKLDGGLFHGRLGALYLLLKATEKESTENILFPFADDDPGRLVPAIQLSIGIQDVRRRFLSRYYNRTINLLTTFPEPCLQQYLEVDCGPGSENDIVRFAGFVGQLVLNNKGASPLIECLEDVFGLERCKLEFFETDKRSSMEIYLDQLLYNDRILECLNRSDEWLLDQPVTISEDVKIVYTKWDWGLYDDFEDSDRTPGLKRQQQNPWREPGRFEYVLQHYARFESNEIHLKHPFTLFLHSFDRPKPIRQAIAEIDHYLQSLSDEEIGRILTVTGLPLVSKDELMRTYGKLILGKIRNWLHRGILHLSFENNII
jgi:Lanthionine synthetase C-like protein